MGAYLEARTDILYRIFPIPKHTLIADFSKDDTGFSSNTVLIKGTSGKACDIASADGRAQISNPDGASLSCLMDILPTQDRTYKELGGIQALMQAIDVDEQAESSVAIQMVADLADATDLRAHCGVTHRQGQLSGFFYIETVGNARNLECPSGSPDNDPSDNMCPLFFEAFVEQLSPNQDHQVELHANPVSPYEFVCVIDKFSIQHRIEVGTDDLIEDPSQRVFERYIGANYTAGSEAIYWVDDIYEVH